MRVAPQQQRSTKSNEAVEATIRVLIEARVCSFEHIVSKAGDLGLVRLENMRP